MCCRLDGRFAPFARFDARGVDTYLPAQLDVGKQVKVLEGGLTMRPGGQRFIQNLVPFGRPRRDHHDTQLNGTADKIGCLALLRSRGAGRQV